MIPPARADNVADDMDYKAHFGHYDVLGWSDATQITCGIANKSDLHQDGYFDIREQVYGLKEQNISDPTRLWDFEYSFFPKKKERIWFEFKSGPDATLVLPDPDTEEPNRSKTEVVGSSNESCGPLRGCGYKQANLMMTILANDADITGILTLSLRDKDGKIVSEIALSGLKGFKSALDKCVSRLLPHLL